MLMEPLDDVKSSSNSTTGVEQSIIYEPMVIRRKKNTKKRTRFSRIAGRPPHSLHKESFSKCNIRCNDNKKRRYSAPTTTRHLRNRKSSSLPPKKPVTKRLRKIRPKLIEIVLNNDSVNAYLEHRKHWRSNHPKNRKINPYLIKKQKRLIAPELIGIVSNESIVSRNQLKTYFNQQNAMFNEQCFAKYTDDTNADCGYIVEGQRINENNTTPIIMDKAEKDKEADSDQSIASNPDDPLMIDSYRRKMIKHKTPSLKHKKCRKITDFFSPLSSK